MDGISLGWRELPESLIERYHLDSRRIIRGEGADPEVRFLYRDPRPLLPVWIDDRLKLCTWGNRDRKSKLPRTCCVKLESIEEGRWQEWPIKEVEIPATYGFDQGIWYQIKQGIRGILVLDESGRQHAYMLTEPASHYYQVMTRNDRMPVLIGERI